MIEMQSRGDYVMTLTVDVRTIPILLLCNIAKVLVSYE